MLSTIAVNACLLVSNDVPLIIPQSKLRSAGGASSLSFASLWARSGRLSFLIASIGSDAELLTASHFFAGHRLTCVSCRTDWLTRSARKIADAYEPEGPRTNNSFSPTREAPPSESDPVFGTPGNERLPRPLALIS